MRAEPWDTVIVGGGPAGLSAALVLGRCCRRVLVCDNGQPRNRASKALHGFITRDGIAPSEFLQLAREQLQRYKNVQLVDSEVTDIARESKSLFRVALTDGRFELTRKVLIATGVVDQLPPIPRIDEFWGKSVHQCPYCDGWELRGAPVAVYGKRTRGLEMARALTAWTSDIALCTDGRSGFSDEVRTHLQRNGIEVIEEKIVELEGEDGQLQALVFDGGRRLPRRALFFDTPSVSRLDLARKLGCQITRKGAVRCGQYEATSVPGVFVAGNLIKDVQLVIVAAAEGTRAAFGINRSLTREDFERRATGMQHVEHPAVDDQDVARRRPQT
ncbi:MAG TPA: NAD(P)/FAD-dependent oxidoreductase [Burkholderiaceae bacterium]|nr:NAD(P)/FAD-dependent oxidoreductase [Burkholderiaceae bacterium]